MYRQYQTAIPVLLNQVRYDCMYRLCLQHDCGKVKRGAQIAPKLYCNLGQYSSRLIILQLGGLAGANRLLPPQPVVVYNNNLFINILHLPRRSPPVLGRYTLRERTNLNNFGACLIYMDEMQSNTIPVVRPAGISVISGTYSSTVDFWIMYKNLQIHAMRAKFHIVFSVRI